MLSSNFYISLYSRTRTESGNSPADTTSVSILLFPLHKKKYTENTKPFIDLYLVLSIKVKLLVSLCNWIWSSFITQLYMGSNLKQCFCCFQFLLKEESKTNLSRYLSQVISAHSSEKYIIKTFVLKLIFVTIFDRLCSWTLLWRRTLDWFLNDRDLRHERVRIVRLF